MPCGGKGRSLCLWRASSICATVCYELETLQIIASAPPCPTKHLSSQTLQIACPSLCHMKT